MNTVFYGKVQTSKRVFETIKRTCLYDVVNDVDYFIYNLEKEDIEKINFYRKTSNGYFESIFMVNRYMFKWGN